MSFQQPCRLREIYFILQKAWSCKLYIFLRQLLQSLRSSRRNNLNLRENNISSFNCGVCIQPLKKMEGLGRGGVIIVSWWLNTQMIQVYRDSNLTTDSSQFVSPELRGSPARVLSLLDSKDARFWTVQHIFWGSRRERFCLNRSWFGVAGWFRRGGWRIFWVKCKSYSWVAQDWGRSFALSTMFW